MNLNLPKNHSWRRWTALVAVLLLLVLALGASAGDAHASGHLWNVWYWNNTDLSGPPVVQAMEPIGFDLALASPHPGVSKDDFSARYTKTITVDDAGNYTFAARVDDGMRVWVDGEMIIDDWTPAAAHEVAATVPLTVGAHEVRVEYFDTRDDALLNFDWGPAFMPTLRLVTCLSGRRIRR